VKPQFTYTFLVDILDRGSFDLSWHVYLRAFSWQSNQLRRNKYQSVRWPAIWDAVWIKMLRLFWHLSCIILPPDHPDLYEPSIWSKHHYYFFLRSYYTVRAPNLSHRNSSACLASKYWLSGYASPITPRDDDPPKKDDSFFLSFVSVIPATPEISANITDNPNNHPCSCTLHSKWLYWR